MEPSRVAFLSVVSNTLVVSLKVIVAMITGSVAVLSEAIHTSLDLAASLIAFFSVRISGRPADKIHPYGHGKIENISGTIETLLIYVAGIWIIYESVKKLIHPEPIQLPTLGVVVMLVGATINFFVSRLIDKTAERTHSVAMKSNAFHLLTDVYTSLGVAVSLLLATLTGWSFLDPIIGIVLACYIMFEAAKLMWVSFPPLLDARLSDKEENKIMEIIEGYKNEFIELHNFRTRRSGPEEYIEFHLVVPSHLKIDSVEELSDRIEESIKSEIPRAQILIHAEPEYERKNTLQKKDSV
ncbi:cation diffusion facilitator family transporter [Sporolactobacillus kofuensis]|uniref:Cation diffusion facilitator family transporter n=1 Tax=Sporolactobacillus kofuensis TaxID=269672 RepID=A0ABW1WGM8_9BACL|nr:cation diffusion facilitator family transporter [Sporolactobacillus kofuensis]MCO7176108.1 cation diffusion facilitator family transporter [Sporolactobacillus kofuensis]